MTLDAKEVGPWELNANVEVQPRPRYSKDEPDLEKGDVLFRIVLSIGLNDDTGEHGVAGELSTAWSWSVADAVKQAKLLRVFGLTWYEYDEAKDDYVLREGSADFDAVIDLAVGRFNTTMPGVG